MFSPDVDRERFARVECDLSDVLGTSGCADDGLLEDVEATLGGSWERLPADDGVFLTGVPGADVGDGHRVGAFSPARRATPVLVEALLAPGRRTGSAESVAASRSSTGRHEVWQQLLRGAPVLGAVYAVHESPDGRIALTGRPLGDLTGRDPGPAPVIVADDCRAAMRAALDLPAAAAIALELVTFPLPGGAVWAVKGECQVSEPMADLRVFLRADDLTLLLSYDVSCSAGCAEGRAYRDNPLRSPAPLPVLLRELGTAEPPCLSGPALDVRPRRGQRLSSTSGDYRAEPTSREFDQVSAYYHARRALRWFTELLGAEVLARSPLQPLSLVTDDPSVRPGMVAVFLPTTGVIAFDGAERNGARSADIVVHEVAHAVSDAVCRLSRSAGGHARALGEGYADYAAASSLEDPRFGDYVKDEPNGARNCSDPALRYPPDFAGPSEPYSTGAAWAAVLWDLRGAVGPEVADMVACNSLSYLAPNSTVEQAVSALLEADRVLFPGPAGQGRHADEIRACHTGRLP